MADIGLALSPEPLTKPGKLAANGPGPFQAKPIGEHGVIPTATAVGNAVYDAIGVQIMDLPITPEKIFSVLQARRTVAKI